MLQLVLKTALLLGNLVNKFIIFFGLTRSTCDSCIYYCRQQREEVYEITFFVLCVYAGLILSIIKEVLVQMTEFLAKESEILTLAANRFIELDIERNLEEKTLHLSQPDFIQTTLERFNMTDCHPVAIPTDPSTKLSATMYPETEGQKLKMVGNARERSSASWPIYERLRNLASNLALPTILCQSTI